MALENYLRRLARSTYYQLLYQSAKDINARMLENKKNLSGIQLIFLYWIRLYSKLYENMHSEEYLDIDVINNDTRLDAYFVLKKVEKEQEKKKTMIQRIKDKLKGRPQNVEETHFIRRKK